MDIDKLIISDCEDFLLKSEIKAYKHLLKNISTSKEIQQKWRLVMLDRKKIKELEILALIIKESFEEELKTDEKGTAYYLVGILMHCLNSYEFWLKLVLIMGSEKYKSTKAALSHVITINCIFKRIMEIIETYFKALEWIEDEYIVSEEKITEKSELLQKLQFNHIAIVIHYLLSQDKISIKTANELYVFGQFEDDFINYLKDYLRIMSIT